jgi:hypothetical protein
LEGLVSSGSLSGGNFILKGDLNFTLYLHEVLGMHPRRDPLEGFFVNLLEALHLVDLKTWKIIPTWRNGNKGDEWISKHLDRFLIHESLVEGPWSLKSWVGIGGHSYHFPIFMKMDPKECKHPSPLKFNHIWL